MRGGDVLKAKSEDRKLPVIEWQAVCLNERSSSTMPLRTLVRVPIALSFVINSIPIVPTWPGSSDRTGRRRLRSDTILTGTKTGLISLECLAAWVSATTLRKSLEADVLAVVATPRNFRGREGG